MARRFLMLCGAVALVIALSTPVSAHANLVRAEPGISASVPTAPPILRLSFSEQPEPRYSEIAVYNAAHERFDRNDLHPAPGDPESLVVSVRDLPQATYTVIWKTTSAVDGHTTGGSFAFVVGAAQLAAGTAAQTVSFSTPGPVEVIAKWLNYASMSVVLGALALWFLVWLPALGSAANTDAIARTVGARIARIAALGALALLGATVLMILVQLTKSTGLSPLGVLRPALLRDFLFSTRTGSIWLLRLLLAIALVGMLPSTRSDLRTAEILVIIGLVLAANALLTTSLLSHAAASALWVPASVILDWLHLLAMTIWIGGLVALAATLPALPRGTATGDTLLRGVIARFSDIALIAVAVLSLSGLYAAWLHIGTLDALAATDYGRALTIKLALFALLLLLGAFNLWRLRPTLITAPAEARTHAATARRFGWVVRAEVIAGIGVLLVTAMLTGLAPSREVAAQQRATSLAQTATAGDLRLTLTPSTLQPGPITYDVLAEKGNTPVRDAVRVTVRFSSRDLGVDETEAITAPQGDGHYRATGPYTALAGTWQVRAIVRRAAMDDVDATFDLPIGATGLPDATASPRPTIDRLTILYGVGWLILVLVILGSAATISRRLSRRQAVPAPIPAAIAMTSGTPRQ